MILLPFDANMTQISGTNSSLCCSEQALEVEIFFEFFPV